MGVDDKNIQINLLLAKSLFPLMGLIAVALFVSPNNVWVIAGLGSTIIGGIVAIANRRYFGHILKSFFFKNMKSGDPQLDR